MMSKPATPPSDSSDLSVEGWRWTATEVFFIFLMFFLFAGSPPPGVGEAHYLAKAKHYWDPSWCQGDMFLESKDAHGVFYWTFGWVTKFVSLPAAAWIGRVVTWLLLAWSWQRLSAALVPQRLMSLLTAGLLLVAIGRFHMAGEWIVGGVEAKGFAYALVFLSLEAVARARWPLAFLLAGGATALHVLVGGWTGVTLGVAWLLVGRRQTSLVALLPALLGAAALSAVGIVPALALSQGTDPQVVSLANRLYVFERLSHHLVFHRFDGAFIVRQAALAIAWGYLAWRMWRSEPALARINAVVLGGLVIALGGIVIDQGSVAIAGVQGLSKDAYQALAAPLLKYYWFRISEALLAAGMALTLGRLLWQALSTSAASGSWGLIVATLAVGANLAEISYQRSQLRLPGSVLQPRPTEDLNRDTLTPKEQFRAWRDVCRWIADNTPKDAKFLTPRRQQTFKWYAGRAEVVSWKDVPQDAAGVVVWKETLDEIHPRGSGQADLTFHSDAELVSLARKHGADYILIDLSRSARNVGLPQLYPSLPRQNRAYAVFRVPPTTPP